MQASLEVVRNPQKAAALLEPQRMRLLEMLSVPDSASGLARRLSLPRQQVNYHLRELEKTGLIRLVGERKKGNCVERLMEATAKAYILSPDAAGTRPSLSSTDQDHFSSTWLMTVSARTVSELAELKERADAAGKRLATLALTADVRFASPSSRAAFAADMTEAFARVTERYHDATAPGGRSFRVMLGGYPAPSKTE